MTTRSLSWILTLGLVIFCKQGFSASPLQEEDRTLLNKLVQGDSAEIRIGKLIEARTSQPNVKDFAHRMVNDHSLLLSETNSWAKNRSIPLEVNPGVEENMMMKQLSGLTGQALDRKYIQEMLEDHKSEVSKVAQHLEKKPNSSISPLLKKTIPILEDHLRLAENVAGQIGISPDAGLTNPKPLASLEVRFDKDSERENE